MKRNVLVELKNGKQIIMQLDRYGEISDPSMILHPDVSAFLVDAQSKLGGYALVNGQLEFDQSKKDAYDLKITQDLQKEQNRLNKVAQAKQTIKALNTDSDLTNAEIKAILKALVILTREG